MRESQQKFFRRKRSPRFRSRCRSLTVLLEHYEKLHISESCCSENQTRCFKGQVFRYLNYIDVQRQTKTSTDVFHLATIDDYRNIDGDKQVPEPWIGVTRFALLNKIPLEGRMWVQGRLTKKQRMYYETMTQWAGRIVKGVQNPSAHSQRQMGRRITHVGSSERAQWHLLSFRTTILIMRKS